MTYQGEVLEDIRKERARQDAKWGDQILHTDEIWTAILGEEYGEAAQEVLRSHFGNKPKQDLYAELIQVAAVATVWCEALKRRGAVD